MKLETFFEKFDQFADAPDAVAKMRELVLNLAVQGKLLEQNPSDESATELLERLGRELTPEQRRRKAAPLSPLSAETSHYELPDGWAWAHFREVAIIASNLVKPDEFLDFTHLAPDNIEKGKGVLLPCRTVREDKVISSNHRFYPGQIVYSKIRPNLAKVVVVDFEGLCSADMYPIDALIDAFYLQIYMLSESFLVQAVKTDTRVAMPKINQTELNAIAVPVPPLAEQRRIVAKVDELMALCDRLEVQQQERETRHAVLARASLARFADAPTPANLPFLFHPSYAISPADLRKSILTLAVQGKLVPQDPNDEPAEELLARLACELTPEQRRNQAAPLAPLPEETLQYELPESWKWARFRDAAIIASNLVKPDDFLEFTHLAPDNIEKGNGVLLSCRTVREDKVISSNHRFYPGQIVYSKIRPNLAKVVVVDFEGLCSADMYPIDALIDPFYLQRYMLSESFLVQAVKTDTRVAMPKINQMELNAIAVPIPPPRRTTPDRGQSGATDGLGGRVGDATCHFPCHR